MCILPALEFVQGSTFSCAHFNGNVCSNTKKGIKVEPIKLESSNFL